MRVSVYATLRAAVGQKTVEVAHADGAPVRELVATLVEQHAALAPLILDGDGSLLRSVHVYVNGRSAVHLPGRLDTPLREGDVIDLIPAVAGG